MGQASKKFLKIRLILNSLNYFQKAIPLFFDIKCRTFLGFTLTLKITPSP